MKFAYVKDCLFGRWCRTQCVVYIEDLQQLVLLEDFMNGLPESVSVYLKKKEVQKLDEAAVLADINMFKTQTFF